MRYVLILLLLMVSSCAYAESTSSGRIRLAASNVAGDNWSGTEKNATDFSVTIDSTKAYPVGSSTVNFTGKIYYAQVNIGDKKNISGDDIKIRVDLISDYRAGVKLCSSLENTSHIKRGGAVTYCKAGVVKAKEKKWHGFSLSSVRKASISARSADALSVGLLLEADAVAQYRDWSIVVDDGDWFISGTDKCNFEIPIRVEYCPKILFVSYDVLVRGDNNKTGILKTLRTGVKYQF